MREVAPVRTSIATDGALMARIAAGDQAAFAALSARCIRRGLRVARRMVNDRDEAEDIVQDALLRLWLHAAAWQPEHAAPSTWFRRIVTNLCIDRLRRRSRAMLLPLERADDVAAPSPDPAADMHAREIATSLERALARLPCQQRRAFTLIHLEQMDNADAARVMGVSRDALGALLGRSRRSLRDQLKDLR